MKALVAVALLASCSTMHMPDNTDNHAAEYKCMVANVWHEARGEGKAGMYAVALVTMNRAARQGASICDVVYAPRQFSWTNNVRHNMLDNIAAVRTAVAIVMTGNISDITNGATHYHANTVAPLWADKMQRVAVIGKHQFYRE